MNHWTQWSWTSSVYIWVASSSMTATLSMCVFVDKWTTSPNFLQVYKTPCCWTFCKLLGLAHCYQHFLYSSGIDICICLVSFPYDIYDKSTHHYPTYGLLYVAFRLGICNCVCQGCQTLFMISSIQGCHFPHCLLCEQHLILKPCCHFPLSVIWLDSTGFGHITLQLTTDESCFQWSHWCGQLRPCLALTVTFISLTVLTFTCSFQC